VLVQPCIFATYTVIFYLAGKLIIQPLAKRSLEKTSEHLATPGSRLALYFTVVIGVGVGLTAAGYSAVITALGAVAAGATVALGFAMQDTVEAFVAGVFILLDKPFTIGDWIEWGDHKGRVKDITIRTTKVETFNNERLTVPNNELANATVKNPVANDKLRVVTVFGIGYDDDIDTVKTVIEDEVNGVDTVYDTPTPDVRLVELGGSTVDLAARYWINPDRGTFVKTRDAVLQAVKERCDEEGLDMPFPTRTIAGDTLTIE
jgi:small-conductance mechanosensitive channel